jgi:hypothetical protein
LFEAGKAAKNRWSRMDVHFWGAMPDLGFDDVVGIFGSGCKRELHSEAGRGLAPDGEPFNQPLARVCHTMGCAVIAYAGAQQVWYLMSAPLQRGTRYSWPVAV